MAVISIQTQLSTEIKPDVTESNYNADRTNDDGVYGKSAAFSQRNKVTNITEITRRIEQGMNSLKAVSADPKTTHCIEFLRRADTSSQCIENLLENASITVGNSTEPVTYTLAFPSTFTNITMLKNIQSQLEDIVIDLGIREIEKQHNIEDDQNLSAPIELETVVQGSFERVVKLTKKVHGKKQLEECGSINFFEEQKKQFDELVLYDVRQDKRQPCKFYIDVDFGTVADQVFTALMDLQKELNLGSAISK